MHKLTSNWAKAVTFSAVALAISVAPASADTRVKMASVETHYRPTAGAGIPEPVSMQSFRFEVEKETNRVRVVVDYTYPSQVAFNFDGGAGPRPTMTQVPGLSYDKESRQIVYTASAQRVVCATVNEERFLLWNYLEAKPTGACTVTAQNVSERRDTGWNMQRVESVDTFFETK